MPLQVKFSTGKLIFQDTKMATVSENHKESDQSLRQ